MGISTLFESILGDTMEIFTYSFLGTFWVQAFLAFALGVATKLSDLASDDGLEMHPGWNIFLGILWGVFGGLVALGSEDMGAFYLGILFSWIVRCKLDTYSHGIGGGLVLAAIFYSRPSSTVQILITAVTFLLFTIFGLMSRFQLIKKGPFINYNIYSFIFLFILTFWYPSAWAIIAASLSNVYGYHITKNWWADKQLMVSLLRDPAQKLIALLITEVTAVRDILSNAVVAWKTNLFRSSSYRF